MNVILLSFYTHIWLNNNKTMQRMIVSLLISEKMLDCTSKIFKTSEYWGIQCVLKEAQV